MQKIETNFSRARNEHKELLFNLKDSIDLLFLNNILLNYNGDNSLYDDNITSKNILFKLHKCIERIFVHDLRIFKPDGSPDCWHFIEGLNWLNPSMSISLANHTPTKVYIPHSYIKQDKILTWIYEGLTTNSLSNKLRYLISDYEHLTTCYEVTAFLRNEKYTDALFLCLQSIEIHQPNLLTQIDTKLYTKNDNIINRTHVRSSSHPEFSTIISLQQQSSQLTTINDDTVDNSIKRHQQASINKNSISYKKVVSGALIHGNRKEAKKSLKLKQSKKIISLKLRPWNSLPNINHDNYDINLNDGIRLRSNTILLTNPIKIPYKRHQRLTASILAINNNEHKVPEFSYKQPLSADSLSSLTPNNELLSINLVKCDDIKIHFDRRHTPKKISQDENELITCSPAAVEDNTMINEAGPSISCLPIKRSILSTFDFCLDSSITKETQTKYLNLFSTSAPGDFVKKFVPTSGEKLANQYGNLDDINLTALNNQNTFSNTNQNSFIDRQYNENYNNCYKKPKSGQSLTSFLQLGQFSRTNTELDRENAHFSVSEAMISAIEQLKWTTMEKEKMKLHWDNKLLMNKKIKTRKYRKIKEWENNGTISLMSTNRNSGSSTSNSVISGSGYSSDESSNCSISIPSDYASDEESCTAGELNYLKALTVSQHSINDHTAYAEWGENSLEALSAEGVALSLIAKFSDKQLPCASDLIWLVSEEDAPQQILPMPGSWSVNPDDKYSVNTFLRGTRDWAPPRSQVIFTRHPAPNRKQLMQQQNNRCAGCGMRVAPQYSNRYRYCEYLGKYHCTGCHRNQISTIPGRVLERWDFSLHPVSVFSYRLLNQIWSYPLFRLNDLNPNLYNNVKVLRLARGRRIQLKFIYDFIMSCRFADEFKTIFDTIPNHLYEENDLWSMNDFIMIKNGQMNKDTKLIMEKCEKHIFNCELCTARGFLCEKCRKKQIIYPWQITIKRCNDCGSCYHDKCWLNNCTKCERLRRRQETLNDNRQMTTMNR